MMEYAVILENVVTPGQDGRGPLRGASLSIPQGRRVHISGGQDGSGQTLLELIGGLRRPSSGRVLVLGQDMNDLDERQTAAFRGGHIGFVSGRPAFWPGMTMAENIALPLRLRGRTEDVGAAQVLESVGMGHIAWAYPKSLSQTEMRCAALARAMIAGPELLILDRAASGLSRREAERFREALRAVLTDKITLLSLDVDGLDETDTDMACALRYGRIKRL